MISRASARRYWRNITKRVRIEYLSLFVGALAFAATAWQAYIANDTEVRSLRGYVLIDSTEFKITPDGNAEVTVTTKNFGTTPIYDFQHWACTLIRPIPSRESDFPDITKVEAPVSVLAPQGTKLKNMHELCDKRGPVDAADRAAVKAGTKALFALGEIRYKDAFGKSRITRYRRYWHDTFNSVSFDDTGGNCADDRCSP
jgi:hypothetical protein